MSQQTKVSSDYLVDFADIVTTDLSDQKDLLSQPQSTVTQRVNVDTDQVKNGLGQLVLTLVKLLHELLERQAIRRMDAGSLTDEEVEQLGIALMQQAAEIDRLCEAFGLVEEDLNLDLGPLGQLL
ncbi:gas vesicle protein K [Endozoicomonas sp. SM1973]|uniref:Gas vesicle protein K n=1 Tax=Spartinivicinus marinus TaxID=2994442 RepID=A0A853I213_9GAMM|nr:gas vesicle protein K [Spartinivicinus marinus]MCX4028915.1 gas vesicle protein K [Spartinivicinus marinus]NYZ65502.1 gas vesicle protein K [Spartinivicinus marinus]